MSVCVREKATACKRMPKKESKVRQMSTKGRNMRGESESNERGDIRGRVRKDCGIYTPSGVGLHN